MDGLQNEGMGLESLADLDSMVSTLTGDDGAMENNTPGTQETVTETEDNSAPPADTSTEEPSTVPETDPATLGDNKSNQAFATMRIQNKKTADALTAVLSMAGLDPALGSNPEELLSILSEAQTVQEAAAKNIDPTVLRRISELERTNAAYEQEKLHSQTVAAIDTLRKQYSLNDGAIVSFLKTLQEHNINPFAQPVDLVREYKIHNMEKLMADAEKRGREAALQDAKRVSQHSSTPITTKGSSKQESSEAEINSMAQFDGLIAGIKRDRLL